MDWDAVEVHIHRKKKDRSQYPAILADHTGSVKDLLHGIQDTIFSLDTVGSLERIRYPYLARSGSQSQRMILVN